MSKREVLITAGGTREPIDNVRFLGNFSAGSFGVEIANAFSEELLDPSGKLVWDPDDPNITLLAPKETTERFNIDGYVRCKKFTSAASLGKLLVKQGSHPNIVVHAAAVADYAPIRQAGKISSDSDELTIFTKRTPKLLAQMRRNFGPRAFLTGFKLLSDVPEEELIEVGRKQLLDNHLDLTVANCLEEIRPLGRRIIALAKDREDYVIEGSTKSVASKLVGYILTLSAQKEASYLATIPKESI